jgi:hypothetical protein
LIPAWLHRKKSNSVGWHIFISTTVPADFRNMASKLLSKHGTNTTVANMADQVEYFPSCPPSGDQWGRALCGASFAQL